MLDLRFIRENADEVRRRVATLYMETPLDDILTLDERHRAILAEVEEARARRNAGSKAVSQERDPAVKVSASRFYFLKGLGARLQRAVIAWMLDFFFKDPATTEIYPPYLVRSESLLGTGQLPKFADNQYHDEPSDLWMIPTAEVP